MLTSNQDLKNIVSSHIELARNIIRVYAEAEEEVTRLILIHGQTIPTDK